MENVKSQDIKTVLRLSNKTPLLLTKAESMKLVCLYAGKFMRRIRSWKRGLERRSSKRASTFSNKSHSACCW